MPRGQPDSIALLPEFLDVTEVACRRLGYQGSHEQYSERPEADEHAELPLHVANSIVASMALERRLFEALGGECEIYGVDITAARLAVGESWVHEMHDRLTRFSPTSELSRFNDSAGSWAEVSPLLESLLRECLRAHELSGGLVNPAVLPALLAAGYTRT